MSERFADLKKVPAEPARRLLAAANVKLATPVDAPATAGVSEVLAELEKAGAPVDMLRLVSVALPGRERAWWACLAARDLIGAEADPPRGLAATEAWVFRPGEETLQAVQTVAESADADDDTILCTMTALYAGGQLGPGKYAEYAAPPGGAAAAAFGMNMMAVEAQGLPFAEALDRLVDRGIDIARGGNGRPQAQGET